MRLAICRLALGSEQNSGFYSEGADNYGKAFNEGMIQLYLQDSCFRMCGECLVLHLDPHSCPPAPKKYIDESCTASMLCSLGHL